MMDERIVRTSSRICRVTPGVMRPQQPEKPPEETLIQALEGGLPIRAPEQGRRIAGGKKGRIPT